MKVLRKISLNRIEDGWSKDANKKAILTKQIIIVLALMLSLSVSLTSCSKSDKVTDLLEASKRGNVSNVNYLLD